VAIPEIKGSVCYVKQAAHIAVSEGAAQLTPQPAIDLHSESFPSVSEAHILHLATRLNIIFHLLRRLSSGRF
jgi:hypothetical protein